ncbi:putative F-box protein At1g32420 [Lycium ferocissimum]|uniref:putative F-box protein At1g32420 n=1 Tax=Lycium ferocissimum TaxID=112874 RepID=UPI0028156671|nr:putative F-box protein At1g32420 [Lycium ferocissimum]
MEKKMNSSGSNPSIPQEIIFEIFSWLPVKSLMRFKCVIKFFNSLVSGSDFTDSYRCRSMTHHGGGTKLFFHEEKGFYMAEQKEDGKISVTLFQTEKLDGLHCYSGSCLDCVNGLFCVWEPICVRRAAIFNPTTREVRFLPDLNKEVSWCNYSLGFESEEKKYKVLLSTEHVREGCRKIWVLTLGEDESWREIQSISPDIVYIMPSVCINGVIYRFVYWSSKANIRSIAAFDIKSEKFNIIALWNSSHYWAGDDKPKLIEVKGNLAVTYSENWFNGYIHLRILEKIKKEDQWKSHIIRLPSIWNGRRLYIHFSLIRIISLCKSSDGDILFIMNLKSGLLCLCYDVTTENWREVEIKGLPQESFIRGGYNYVENLVAFG